ncbi:hypothetical protein LY78DRAFT_310740 [Colletotrichum sublineola]|nr:hypothetical protein LY78DRAFT_310740 [Colletotrichum sublineola]
MRHNPRIILCFIRSIRSGNGCSGRRESHLLTELHILTNPRWRLEVTKATGPTQKLRDAALWFDASRLTRTKSTETGLPVAMRAALSTNWTEISSARYTKPELRYETWRNKNLGMIVVTHHIPAAFVPDPPPASIGFDNQVSCEMVHFSNGDRNCGLPSDAYRKVQSVVRMMRGPGSRMTNYHYSGRAPSKWQTPQF